MEKFILENHPEAVPLYVLAQVNWYKVLDHTKSRAVREGKSVVQTGIGHDLAYTVHKHSQVALRITTVGNPLSATWHMVNCCINMQDYLPSYSFQKGTLNYTESSSNQKMESLLIYKLTVSMQTLQG